MNRLSGYVLREYVKILCLTLFALVFAYLTLDFFEKIRKFVGFDAEAADIVRYFLLRLPRVLFDVTPMAILLSTLLTIGIMAKNNELVAIKSCGINLYRIAFPLIASSLGLSFLLLGANLSFIPNTLRSAVYVKDFLIEKKSLGAVSRLDRVWLLMPGHSIYNIQLIDPEHQTLYGVAIYKLTPDFSLQSVTLAREMTYRQSQWILRDGVARYYSSDGSVRSERFQERPISLRRAFDDFKTMEIWSDEMTYQRLNRYVGDLKKSGFASERFAVDVQGKLALPFAAFITSIIGIAFALGSPRGAGIAKSIGISLLVGVLYWIVYSTTVALGRGGLLHPVAAAWFSNVLFLSLGIFLFVRVRQ